VQNTIPSPIRPLRAVDTALPDEPDAASARGADEVPDERLYTSRQVLIYTLRYSHVFPAATTEDWIAGLAAIETAAPERGRSVLTRLRDGFEQAKREHRPGDADKGTGVPARAVFDRETLEIERHLAAIEDLLAALAAAGPEPGA